jgi:hypothetical protein
MAGHQVGEACSCVCGCVHAELLLHRELKAHESDCAADENQATFSGKRVGPEFFGVVWTGFLKPSMSGVYTINTVTTDTTVLSLDGAVLIDCRTTCMDATARLVQGVMYAVRLEYRSFAGNSSISLRWMSGREVPYEVIPSGNLFSSVVAGSLSALTFRALPNVVDNRNTLVWGTGLTIATAGIASTFDVRVFDRFGNVAWNVMNLNVLLHPIGSMFQRSRYQSQQTALGSNAIALNGNLPIAATYYLTSGMHATYYNAALRATTAFPTQIAATYYSWSVSVTLPTKGTYEITAVPWASNAGLYATYYDNADFSNAVSSFTQASVDFSTPALTFPPLTQTSRLSSFGFGAGTNVTDARSFAARWRGFIQATASNVLTFSVVMKSNTERAKLWVDGMVLINFDDFPYNTLNAAATVAVAATDTAGLPFSGVNSLFEVVLEYRKPSSSSSISGITMTFNTQLTGYHYAENHASLPHMTVLPSAACASSSSLAGPGLTRATAGAASTFDIHIRDSYGSSAALPAAADAQALGSDFVVARLVPNVCEVTGRCAFVRGNVTSVDEHLGRFQGSYKPSHKGAYDLIVSIAIMGKLVATYYTSASFAGTRSVVNKNYSPAAVTVAAGTASVRYQGFLRPPQPGVYTVYVASASAVAVSMRLVDPVANVAVTGTSSGNAAATVNVDVARSLFDIRIEFDSAQSATLLWKYGSMNAAAAIPSAHIFSRNDIKNSASVSTPWGSAGVMVVPADTCSSLCILRGTGLSLATAGIEAKLSIVAVDSFLNDRAVSEDEWIVRLSSSGGNFSASVFPDTRVLQPAVYNDGTYSSRTGAGRYIALYTPTRSGTYSISVQRLSQPGLSMQIFCSAVASGTPCQASSGSLPLISKDVLITQDAQLAALAGVGFTAVWKGFLAVKTTETLTFTAVANGTVSLSIDDKVCGAVGVCYVLVFLSR